jgi:predicted DNA-binding transcriptional regulator YafY
MSVAVASVGAMNRTDRLYAIVEELRAVAPRSRTARELSQRYEVSVRTVERDISALQQAGVPIYATPGRRGGYALDKATTLPPLNFTPREATAIAVALSREGATPFPHAARGALLKVLAAMPARDLAAAAELVGRVRLLQRQDRPGEAPGDAPRDRPGDGSRDDAAQAPGCSADAPGDSAGEPRLAPSSVIEDAIVDRLVLQIEYSDRNGVVSRRAVEPVAVVARGPYWYLVAWCRLRGEARAFRTDRVLRALATGERADARHYEEVVPQIPDLVARMPSLA